MTGLVAQRWTNYGKDRVYVSTADGERVGWLDLLDDSLHLEAPDLAKPFAEALRPFLTDSHSAPAEVRAPAPTEPLPGKPAWTDLAGNRPGLHVRAEAEAHLTEMRERSPVSALLARALDLKTDERAYRVGAKGEEAVGARLEKLAKHGWRVLHSIPVGQGRSDIDHLLIGRGGVYTINTKNHPGKQVWVGQHVITVGGHHTRYIPIARYEAHRAHTLLTAAVGFDVPARAVLVVLTGTVIPQVTVKQMPDDVLVLNRTDVPGVFRQAPRRLTDAQIQQVYEQTRRSTTWR